MSDRRSGVYKGKGFVLMGAKKEYVENAKRRKRKSGNKGKESIFNKLKPVTAPLLNPNKNANDAPEEKGRKSKKELDVLNENEINSFLLRNKAFRLAWQCVIEKIQEEIYLEIYKNFKNVFDEIYLYSISNNEYLPLILIAAGTNVMDHEIIIDTLSYALKTWKHKDSENDSSNLEAFHNLRKNESKMKRKTRNINEEGHKSSLLDKINYAEDAEKDENVSNNDMYICSLNSSTSNSINAAVFNIYEQLLKEYEKRYREKNSRGRLNRARRSCSNVDSGSRGTRRRGINSSGSNILDINTFEKELAGNIEDGKEVEWEEGGAHKKVISVDKLISLYKALSELERKEESSSEEESSEEEDTEQCLNEKFLHENFGEFALYNKTSNYFNDGRKKIRVIILIHDCEYFNINVLNGILNVLINLRIDNKICLSVILGVSTPSFFFNRITNPDTQSKLRIKTIDVLNNKLICENICHGILFDNILPFIVNFRTVVAIKLLLHKNNQSISHLINILYILTKEFYDNNLFSFLCLPVEYYLSFDGDEDTNQIQGESVEDIYTEYSHYTYVRSYQKSFKHYSKYDMRNLHKKIICLCYCANIYFRHLSFIKKKYSSILVKGYFDLHGDESQVHTPSNSDDDNPSRTTFTLKKTKTQTKTETETNANINANININASANANTSTSTNTNTNTNPNYNAVNVTSINVNTSRPMETELDQNLYNRNEAIQELPIRSKQGTLVLDKNKQETRNDVIVNENNMNSNIKNNTKSNIKSENEDVTMRNETEFETTTEMETTEAETDEMNTSEFDTSVEKKKKKEKKKKPFDLSVYAWQFKANTINWWFDHPFKDLVYSYEFPKPKMPPKKEAVKYMKEEHVKKEKGKETEEEDRARKKEEMSVQLFDVDNIKEINKTLCETLLPKSVLQLIERKYAFSIAINFISIILKTKPEYNNSTKRFEYFRTIFENYEKVKWNENKSILYIEEIYKTVETDVKKCINFMIEIISPLYFRNHDVLLKVLKEFKKYYSDVYPIVYNIESYLYMLKQKENEKDTDIFRNDDFAKSCANYTITFSIYYSLLFKLDNLIEMLRKYINEMKTSTLAKTGSKVYYAMKSKNVAVPTLDKPKNMKRESGDKQEENGEEEEEEEEVEGVVAEVEQKEKERNEEYGEQKFNSIYDMNETQNEYENENNPLHNISKKKTNKERVFARYLTMENPSLKKKDGGIRTLSAEDISDVLNMFIHDYLYLLLLPPVFFHPLAYELFIHKPDKDFTEFIARDIKSEILTTLSYTNPYKTGNLMCSCCFDFDKPDDRNMNTNITCNQKLYLNPYYDNMSTLEDLVNIYRIYERCGKTIDLYNFFIYFLNIKIDKFLGYSIEEKEVFENVSQSKEHLFSEMLQEYYLRFIIAISTFCSFFKILKPPNVSALLNYDDKDFLPEDYDSRNATGAEISVAKFLSEIRKSLQGCTSKKLLFGKYYYNQTIISREFYLMRAVQVVPDLELEQQNADHEMDDDSDTQQRKGEKRRRKG